MNADTMSTVEEKTPKAERAPAEAFQSIESARKSPLAIDPRLSIYVIDLHYCGEEPYYAFANSKRRAANAVGKYVASRCKVERMTTRDLLAAIEAESHMD